MLKLLTYVTSHNAAVAVARDKCEHCEQPFRINCYRCNEPLIPGGDHDFEDMGIEGEGIVTNLSCSSCNAYYLAYQPFDDD